LKLDHPKAVISGLDPGIWCRFGLMAGSSPAMTDENDSI
jgi:hypothetical protein